ncbi:MAG: flagellar protein FliO/FliZ [Lentisphaeria bacterium]|jgi:flagellar protein FliO/FliZ
MKLRALLLISVKSTVGSLFFPIAAVYAEQVSKPVVSSLAPPALFSKVVIGLLVVTALIFALAWLVKYLGGSALLQQQGMRIISTLPLGTREKAILIEIDNQRILVGVAPGRVSSLHVFEKSESNSETEEDKSKKDRKEPLSGDFSVYLKDMLKSVNKKNAINEAKPINTSADEMDAANENGKAAS